MKSRGTRSSDRRGTAPGGADRRALSWNLAFITVLSLAVGIQTLALIGWAFQGLPLETSAKDMFFPGVHREMVMPERDALLYRILVVLVLLLQAGFLRRWRRRLADGGFTATLLRLTGIEVFWASVTLFWLFKMAVYHWPAPVRVGFLATLGLAVLSKVLWIWMGFWPGRLLRWIDGRQAPSWVLDLTVVAAVVLLLAVGDRKGILAHIFVEDQFWHFDPFFMAPGWAHLKGCALNKDVWSAYGVGMPIITAHLARWIGGFDYENVLTVLVGLSGAYVLACYAFLRVWLRRPILVFGGTALLMKVLLFSQGPDYLIWRTPSMTPVRYVFDVVFLAALWGHTRRPRVRALVLAGLSAGLSLAYVTDSGVYQTAAYFFYIVMFVLCPPRGGRRDLRLLAFVFLPLAGALAVLRALNGPAVFQIEFWRNLWEYIRISLSGYGLIPIYWDLQHGEFLASFMAVSVVLTYLFAFLYHGTRVCLRRDGPGERFVVLLAVYGLASFHYFVNRSIARTFFTVSGPWVFIVCYWVAGLAARVGPTRSRRIEQGFAGLAIVLLLLTHSCYRYPHWWKHPGERTRMEKARMVKSFYHSLDADLIARWTRPDEEVCILSSFSPALLIAADRRPFFYYFNLVFPRPMDVLDFGGWRAYTAPRFERTFRQIREGRPRHVFVERKLYERLLPEKYYTHFFAVAEVLNYLERHYRVRDAGPYLLVLERKEGDSGRPTAPSAKAGDEEGGGDKR